MTGFAKVMPHRSGQHDPARWLQSVEADDQPELHSAAGGIGQDLDTITAG